jgi:hypothetical protein
MSGHQMLISKVPRPLIRGLRAMKLLLDVFPYDLSGRADVPPAVTTRS